MLKSVKSAIFLSVAISAFNASSVYANEWFDQQRGISDGDAYSAQEPVSAGMQGRSGPVSVSINNESSSLLDRQLSTSDGSGYAADAADALQIKSQGRAGTFLVSANSHLVPVRLGTQPDGMQRQFRITDGTSE